MLIGVENYIHIRGEESTAPYQGYSGGTSTTTPGTTPDTMPVELWNAQTAAINGEIAYLKQLQNQFKDKQNFLEGTALGDMIGYLKEIAEEFLIFRLLRYLNLSTLPAIVVSATVDFLIGAAFDALIDLLKDDHELLEAMIAEDTELLTSTCSVVAYEARNMVLDRHIRQIESILAEIRMAETEAKKQISQNCDLTKIEDRLQDIIDHLEDADPLNTEQLEAILKESLMRPKYVDGQLVTDGNGNPVYENFFDTRLEDIAYNDASFRVGDVEINTRGRYIKHS